MSQHCSRSTNKLLVFAKKHPWLFPITGLIALVWFMVRVIPKPSRALYPCQQVATPIASGFVAWIIASVTGLLPSIFAFNVGKKRLKKARGTAAALFFIIAVSGYGVYAFIQTPSTQLTAADAPFVSAPANEPVGVGRGVNPGRVVWIYDSTSANAPSADNWWSDTNTDTAVVESMMADAILNLAGEETLPEAWDALIRSFNIEYGNGERGYQAGEKFAVKLNMNNYSGTSFNSTEMYNSPQAVNALVKQLIEDVGVAGADITIYDASRGITDQIIDKIQANEGQDYQDVKYVVSPQYPAEGRITAVHDETHPVCFADTTMLDYNTTYLPTCVTEAAYLINCGNLKGHGLGGVTLCAKNFFGSVYRPTNEDATLGWTPNGSDKGEDGMYGIHYYMNPLHTSFWNRNSVCEMGDYNALVELMGHEQLGGKVMLFLIDAIYTSPDASNDAAKWQSAPFNNGWTGSIFASQDFVAIESVGLDFLVAEPTVTTTKGSLDNYLHEAAQADNPPSGTFYDPEGDGTRLMSLGVHEHWNNATDKQYSRDLGTGEGIELVRILRNMPPLTPELVKEEGPGKVTLTWNSCGENVTYKIKRRPVPGAFEVIAEGLTECSYVDEGLEPNVLKVYQIIAINASAEIESNQVSAIPQEVVSVEESPVEFDLTLNNYPNPFNPSTRIAYAVPADGQVTMAVFNLVGQRMATLVDTHLSAGEYSVNWHGVDEMGQRASAGVYIVRLQAGSSVTAKKITLMY